jgi:hypothetical protein
MRIPRYRLRTLIAGITLIGVVLGCVFGGWAESCLIALSLDPGESRVFEETVEGPTGQRERLIRRYTIDPGELVLNIDGEPGKTVEIVAESHDIPYMGLRWLRMSISIRNGELRVGDATSGREIYRGATQNEDWPGAGLHDSESVAERGIGFNLAPGVWMHPRMSREP